MSKSADPAETPNVLDRPEELHMDFQPVLRLALWVHDHHEPVDGQCNLCGPAPCQPFSDANKILMAAGAIPYMVVSAHDGSRTQAGRAAA